MLFWPFAFGQHLMPNFLMPSRRNYDREAAHVNWCGFRIIAACKILVQGSKRFNETFKWTVSFSSCRGLIGLSLMFPLCSIFLIVSLCLVPWIVLVSASLFRFDIYLYFFSINKWKGKKKRRKFIMIKKFSYLHFYKVFLLCLWDKLKFLL